MATTTNVKSGFLTKEGYVRKSWKKRWFVLDKDTISYYNNQQMKSRLGVVSLKDVRRTAPIVGYKKKIHCIEMETPHRTFYMFATSQEEMKTWQEAIQSQVNIAQGKKPEHETKTNEKKESKSTTDPGTPRAGFFVKLTPDDFDMLYVIGQGSFGKVVQVRYKGDGKIYAMKILNKKNILERGEENHTKAEQNILKKVEHPFLVNLHYSFHTGDKLYLIMDFVNGGELFYHLQNERKFANDRACFYAAEIVLGLEHLHNNGVVYRDLKPENLLLNSEGHICMTDFGLSKEGLESKDSRTSTFCGTPEYLAPEVLEGKEYGRAVDWWSFGTLLFEMLTGLPPFYDEDVQKMYTLKMTAQLEIPDGIEPNAKTLIMQLLERDPEKRISDAKEIKKHPYFESIDWDALYHKKVTPPYKPPVKSSESIENIDPSFIEMDVKDQDESGGGGVDAYFPDFTYQGGGTK